MTIATTEILDATMEGLEAGLQVGLIATRDLVTCNVGQTVGEVRSDRAIEGLDNLPVEEGGRIVGVLEVSEPEDALVGAAMQPLTDKMLASASMPIGSFIRQLHGDERDYWLVVENRSIAGIVTRSELLQLPVRLFAFALVTHLELLMAQLISSRMSDDVWLEWLKKEGRDEGVYKLESELKALDLEPREKVTLTQFCDKRMIVKRLMGYSNRFNEQLVRIEKRLRNPVAHAGDFVTNDQSLEKFIQAVIWTEDWIKKISLELDTVTVGDTD